MGIKLKKALLPEIYDTYVFDLYGTLVDIRTDESQTAVWEKLALFYGYYGASYRPKDLKLRYELLVTEKERTLKTALEGDPKYTHEASPEIELTEVFLSLFEEKNILADRVLAVHAGQFFRILATEYVKTYPGTRKLLAHLKALGKNIYLLSNAQRIFTAYEMNTLGIAEFFDDILISSDFQTKKPDVRFLKSCQSGMRSARKKHCLSETIPERISQVRCRRECTLFMSDPIFLRTMIRPSMPITMWKILRSGIVRGEISKKYNPYVIKRLFLEILRVS